VQVNWKAREKESKPIDTLVAFKSEDNAEISPALSKQFFKLGDGICKRPTRIDFQVICR
jgi:hypothetical protein